MIDFEKTFEETPNAFHDTVVDALDTLPQSRPFPRRRVTALAAALVVLMVGVAAAIVTKSQLMEFLGMEPEQITLPIASEFTIDGSMDKVDVTVREAIYDGARVRMTVAFSLKEAENNVMIYVPADQEGMWEQALRGDPAHGLEKTTVQNAENIHFLFFTDVGFYTAQNALVSKQYDFAIKSYCYESPTQIVMLIDMDVRAKDGTVAHPLKIHMGARLYCYDEAIYTNFQQQGSFYIVNNLDNFDMRIMFPRVDKGRLDISVNALEQEAKVYQVNGLPEDFLGYSATEATLTETPLAYYLNIWYKRDENVDNSARSFGMLDALDENNETFSSYSYIGHLFFSQEFEYSRAYEIVYMKHDDRRIVALGFHNAAEPFDLDVYPITLVPLEE